MRITVACARLQECSKSRPSIGRVGKICVASSYHLELIHNSANANSAIPQQSPTTIDYKKYKPKKNRSMITNTTHALM